jgi:hypothetical protein
MKRNTGSGFMAGFCLLAALLAACAFFCGCKKGGLKELSEPGQIAQKIPAAWEAGAEVPDPEKQAILQYLENIAELERSGIFTQGMGMRESVLLERLGDFAGAVAAAYKELSWAYGMGIIQLKDLEQGLGNALALDGEPSKAAKGFLAFVHEQWAEAGAALKPLFTNAEPDSFAQWTILSCCLEQDRGDRQSAASYRAIRARYEKFPEYWYRGARAFSGDIAAEYAERCIGLAPAGPFAEECRAIMASHNGLKAKDFSSLRSRLEIENMITESVNQSDPQLLGPLMPLISLPENSYTVYAVGALRALAAVPKFRDYFQNLASNSSGRLAERLNYICRVGS